MLNLDNFAHSNVLEKWSVCIASNMSAKVMYHSPHIAHHHLELSLSLSSQNSYAKVDQWNCNKGKPQVTWINVQTLPSTTNDLVIMKSMKYCCYYTTGTSRLYSYNESIQNIHQYPASVAMCQCCIKDVQL